MMPQTRNLPLQTRAATIEPSTFSPDRGTVQVCWTTGAAVRRIDWMTGDPFDEELVVDPAAVNMSRFDAGAVQVLDGHDRTSGVCAILGIAERGWIDKGQGLADLRLSQRPELAGIVGDIRAGIIRDISFGYSVERYEVIAPQDRTDGGTLPLWRAVAWTPQEISFVPVPADPNAGTRSADTRYPCEINHRTTERRNSIMPTTTADDLQTRAEDIAEIRELASRQGLPDAFMNPLIDRGTPRAELLRAMVEELGRRDRAAGGHLNVRPLQTADARDPREQMVEALAARMGGPGLDRENQYRHVRVTDMARDLLETRGVRTTAMSPSQLVERAISHTTSDFPDLLTAAGNRALRLAYAVYTGGLRKICRESTVRDFRAKQRLMLGEAPALLKVNEAGEFKQGTMAESKNSYSLATYGRIFSISRAAIINDDLDAFGTMVQRMGRAAAEMEAGLLVTLLTSNPVMDDGLALFHASHNNYATGAGSALQFSSLSTAKQSMRLQKGLDGTTPIDATPHYLVVPAALEQTGAQLVSANYTPTKSTDINTFAGQLELVVDPRLDAISSTAWYLSSDPSVIDTLEYSYLDSELGPQIFTRLGFEVDGLEFKCREDFGAGAIDWRGIYKAAGA